MLSLYPHKVEFTSDVAARLTDVALEILARVGADGDSVATELELWRALTMEIDRELRGRRFSSLHATEWLDDSLERIIYRAALRVASRRVSARVHHPHSAAEHRNWRL